VIKIIGRLCTAVTFAVCAAAQASAAPPVEKPLCEANPELSVIDSSITTTTFVAQRGELGLSALKRFGVKTIYRYYDLPNETLRGKRLRTPLEITKSEPIAPARLANS
jgi:hypothetical protein